MNTNVAIYFFSADLTFYVYNVLRVWYDQNFYKTSNMTNWSQSYGASPTISDHLPLEKDERFPFLIPKRQIGKCTYSVRCMKREAVPSPKL